MHRSEKIDSAASERLVFLACPQKLSIIHKNGNFICRWREKMLDVDQSCDQRIISAGKKIVDVSHFYQNENKSIQLYVYLFMIEYCIL